MTIYLHTQGCKVNQYETQAMREMLVENGYDVRVFESGLSDIGNSIILINSCTVTGESDRKLKQFIRRCKREHPSSIILLTGCYSQAFPKEAEAIDEVDILLGNSSRKAIIPAIQSYLDTGKRVIDIRPHEKEMEPLCIHQFDERTRAFVKIQDGCDCFCTYCIIPFSRGRIRSRSLEDLKEEIVALSKNGYSEIVLTGINLTAYGKHESYDLGDAVKLVGTIPGIERIRLGSLEPDDMTDALIAKLKAEPKLCPQFHISLQSGCTETLKRMRRRYTAEEYADVCNRLRAAFPDCALTTDVMVGFAGETNEEFNTSLEFVKSIQFAKVHVFPYSIRPGTKAAQMDGQLSSAEKNDRCRKMIAVADISRLAFLNAHVGKTVTVLTETRTKDGYTEGYTEDYTPVFIHDVIPSNTLVSVKITSASENGCIGELF